jgi:hypothetical protein
MKFCQLTPPRLAGYLEISPTKGTTLKIKQGRDVEVKEMKFAPYPLGLVAVRGRWVKQQGKNKSEVKWLVLLPWSSPACDGAGEVKGAALYEGYMPGRLSWGDGLVEVLETPEVEFGAVDPVGVRWGWLTWKRDGDKVSAVWMPHPIAQEDVWGRFKHIHAEESRRWLNSRVAAAEVRGWLAVAPEVKASSADMFDGADPFGPPPGAEAARDPGGFGPPPGPYSNPPPGRGEQLLEDAARRSALAGEQGPPPAPPQGRPVDPNAPPF